MTVFTLAFNRGSVNYAGKAKLLISYITISRIRHKDCMNNVINVPVFYSLLCRTGYLLNKADYFNSWIIS